MSRVRSDNAHFLTDIFSQADTYPVGGSVNWDFRSGARSSFVSTIAGEATRNRELFLNSEKTDLYTSTSSTSKDSNIGIITFQFNVMVSEYLRRAHLSS